MKYFLLAPLIIFLPFCSTGNGSTVDAIPDGPVDGQDDFLDTTADLPYDPHDEHGADTPLDEPHDPFDDAAGDIPADTPADESPETRYRLCLQSCSVPESCCTSEACGTYPDRWSCDGGYCVGVGCLNDAECATWAGGYGLPGAENYKCRGFEGGYRSCVAGCSVPEDCCNPHVDCSRYPMRYLCDDGGCLIDGCRDDGECRAYAAEYALYRSDLYVCRDMMGTGHRFCIQSCSSEADCCSPEHAPCAAYPYHYACTDSVCTLTCLSDPECQAYARESGMPNPDAYVCRELL